MKLFFSNYKLGAGVATDLVNTSPVVRRSTGESLTDPAALGGFLTSHCLQLHALAGDRRPLDGDLADVRALRGTVRAVLAADTEERAVEAATALVGRAAVGPTLRRDTTDRWEWCVEISPRASVADELAALMGIGLLGTLRALSHDRFRHCASPDCDGMFVDTSKAGRRRYCMPDVCGNRVNVASHRARRRTNC